jgi:hypothetical protein
MPAGDDANTNPNADGSAKPDPDAESDAKPHTDGHAHTDADADAHTEPDGYAHAEPDAKSFSVAFAGRDRHSTARPGERHDLKVAGRRGRPLQRTHPVHNDANEHRSGRRAAVPPG